MCAPPHRCVRGRQKTRGVVCGKGELRVTGVNVVTIGVPHHAAGAWPVQKRRRRSGGVEEARPSTGEESRVVGRRVEVPSVGCPRARRCSLELVHTQQERGAGARCSAAELEAPLQQA